MPLKFGDRQKVLTPLRERFRRMPIWQRALLALFVGPPLLAGGTAGAYYLRLHQNADSASISELPIFPAPEKEKRYLILAPHCDDETLAVGGFIADAASKGANVTVAFFTNGDGFTAAATRDLKEVRISPSDYVRFAEHRQKESLAAVHTLGVPEAKILFLGYPDRGLRPMWEQNMDRANPYRSFYTGHTHSPYKRTFTPRTEYCGASLEADLVRLLEEVKPTDVFVTHPADDHPDHSAAASFAQAALRRCVTQSQDTWASSAEMHYYIVHRGDWPLPQGKRPEAPLTPPPGLAATDTLWRAYMLSESAEKTKDAALSHYISQLNISRRFLTSFIRGNELFGEMNTPTLTIDSKDWTTVAKDGRRDDVVRYVDPAADLTGIAIRRTQTDAGVDALNVRVSVRGPVVPKRLRYTLLLRSGQQAVVDSSTGNPSLSSLTLLPVEPNSHTMEATVPLTDLIKPVSQGKSPAPQYLWVAAETRWQATANLPIRPVDRIGYRPFELSSDTDDSHVSQQVKQGKPTMTAR